MSVRRLLTVGGVVALAATGAIANLANAGGRPLATELTGAEEVQPGDPDATGSASLTLNQGRGELCLDLSWVDIDGNVVAAHIHEASAGVNGPVVVGLFSGSLPGTGSFSGCVTVDRALIKEIRQDADNYYVNVHSSAFPGGAVRGQLGD